MTKPLPHRPGKGGGKKRAPQNNRYRIDGDTAFLDVGTAKFPGRECVIDLSDLPLALDGKGKWYARSANGRTVYATRTVLVSGKKTAVQLHRRLFDLGPGHDPVVDHDDGDGLNNRRRNLRITDHAHNRANGRACRPGTYKGVSLRKSSGTYRARIRTGGVLINLGSYPTAEAAARAYDEAARLHFKEFARTNLPSMEPPNV